MLKKLQTDLSKKNCLQPSTNYWNKFYDTLNGKFKFRKTDWLLTFENPGNEIDYAIFLWRLNIWNCPRWLRREIWCVENDFRVVLINFELFIHVRILKKLDFYNSYLYKKFVNQY